MAFALLAAPQARADALVTLSPSSSPVIGNTAGPQSTSNLCAIAGTCPTRGFLCSISSARLYIFWTDQKMTVIGPSCALSIHNQSAMPGAAQMHATTTAQLSSHSGAEKSKHRAFGHIFAIALGVVVLASEAAWVALLGYGLIFLFS
jgi:hypothetical protein